MQCSNCGDHVMVRYVYTELPTGSFAWDGAVCSNCGNTVTQR